MHTDVTRRMSRGWYERDFLRDLDIWLDEVGQAGTGDRIDGVRQVCEVMIPARPLEHLPMLILFTAKQITRIREGRHPAAIHFARVPADVIEMHVRAQDFCDCFRRVPRSGQVFDERGLHICEYRVLTLAIIADTSVDHDLLCARAQSESLERNLHPAIRCCKIREEPVVLLGELWRRAGHQYIKRVFVRVDFDDADNFDVSNFPLSDVFDGHRNPQVIGDLALVESVEAASAPKSYLQPSPQPSPR